MSMSRRAAAVFFGALWLIGLSLSALAGNDKAIMQGYAILLCLGSLVAVGSRVIGNRKFLLSCYAVVVLVPIWFLYLEAVFTGGDCWMLPANAVVHTLSYSAFFLMVFNLAYCAKPPAGVIRFHERSFMRSVKPAFLPLLGISLTLITFVVVLARYGWSWEATKDVYLAGRAGGSGLIRRGGIGGWEVFIQPLDFMCASVPTIAALSWVRFSQERMAPLLLRIAVSACGVFLVFVMFLGGSRGNMAVYLAGPAAIWVLFGRNVMGRVPYYAITVTLFIGLIGIWQYQQMKRSYLLKDVGGVSDIVAQTKFDPRKTHRDNNLYIFTLNHMYRPSPYPFEGYNEFYTLLVNPIPRVLWPGKPKGIQESSQSFSVVQGVEAMGPIRLGTASLSRSVLGDGFKMHHYFGIALYAVIFGLLASAWDYIGQRRFLSSKLYFILNSSWLFWLLWGFRGGFAFFTGVFPVWGAYLLCFVAGKFGRPIVMGPRREPVRRPSPSLSRRPAEV
jgi:hypothetical protein